MPNVSNNYVKSIQKHLKSVATAEKAASAKRYFPNGIHCIGATAVDIKAVISVFQTEYPGLSAEDVLLVSEAILENYEYSEEVLVAFGLINHLVKKYYSDDLLLRFEYWLENYASNWSHVDDLCIKTIYNFLLARPHLIEKTQHWSQSKVPWCRRASNVVWVKFINRKIGKSTYHLDKNLVFENCDKLKGDEDEFVQKSVGWLLKVTSLHYQSDVIEYIRNNHTSMERSTIRYALEKVDKDTRKNLLTELK